LDADGGVFRTGLDGGTPVPIATDPAAWGPVTDDAHVYWVTAGSAGHLASAPLAGGPMTVLVPDLPYPAGLAADGSHVYFASGDPAHSWLYEVPLDGGAVVSLVPNLSPSGIVVDATSVYWITWNTFGGSVMKLTPK
jgi:hypothetical protein